MKKSLFLFMILLVSVIDLNAQTYSINKHNYDYHLYVRQQHDPYIPEVSGVCSFIIPGLGQMINGEPARGLSFLGGSIGCGVMVGVGGIISLESIFGGDGRTNPRIASIVGPGLMIVGMGGMIAIDVWSIVDAVKVAKVNNMYYQDQRKKRIGLELKPSIESFAINNKMINPIGLTLKVSF